MHGWTLVCAAIVILAFFVAPAGDTGTEGYEPITGAEVFFVVSIATAAAWSVGMFSSLQLICLSTLCVAGSVSSPRHEKLASSECQQHSREL